MPKETISTTYHDLGDDWKQSESLAVGWDKDGGEVAIRLDLEPSAHRWDDALGFVERDEPGASQSIPLARPQINGLIRALRKVRDQVFGADA